VSGFQLIVSIGQLIDSGLCSIVYSQLLP